MGPERPRRHPARRPRRAGEESDNPDPRVPEGHRGEPGHETHDRRHGSVHGEVLRPGAAPGPLRGRDLHRLRPGRGPAEVLRRRGRVRDRVEVRDPGPRRPGGARLRPAGRRRELPRDPRIRARRGEWRPVRAERRARLRRRHPPLPARARRDARSRPGNRAALLRRTVHTAARASLRSPRGRVRRMDEPPGARTAGGPRRSPRVSVIVPTWNEAKYLPTLFESLQRQTVPPDEVIVADSGSSDGTPEVARAALAIRSRSIGRFVILPITVETSMRRFRTYGYLRTILQEYIASTILYYATGRTPRELFRPAPAR